MMKKWWPLFVIIPLALLAGVGVLYGVLSHEEAGFGPEGSTWTSESVPLLVCVQSGADDEDIDTTSTVHAIGALNVRLGFTLFALAPSHALCDVEVLLNAPIDVATAEPAGGASRLVERGERLVCEVSLLNVIGDSWRSVVTQHELGHCVGLAHDDFRESLMYPVQTVTYDEESWDTLRLSDHDAELLRRTYGEAP